MESLQVRLGIDRFYQLLGALLPGLSAGMVGGYAMYQGTASHPDRIFRSLAWSTILFLVFAAWQFLIRPRLADRRLNLFQKIVKFLACVLGCFLLGSAYGDSLTPPDPNPGQTLGGFAMGLIGLFIGGCLGWTWDEHVEIDGPDIGFDP